MSDRELSPKDRQALLTIARQSIETCLKEGRELELAVDAENLMARQGAFVTLKNHGELRGCIGRIESDIPLYQVVSEMAAAAAAEDSRFLPVEAEELKDIEIEISVLSPLKKITDAGEIKLGEHGVLVRKGLRSGVFLPQVAEETGWNLEEFMNNLCVRKAGLSPDCWKTGAADIYVFTAEVFGNGKE